MALYVATCAGVLVEVPDPADAIRCLQHHNRLALTAKGVERAESGEASTDHDRVYIHVLTFPRIQFDLALAQRSVIVNGIVENQPCGPCLSGNSGWHGTDLLGARSPVTMGSEAGIGEVTECEQVRETIKC